MPPDTPLSEMEFVAFDTETTGCASATGRMVEIGAVRFRLDGVEVDRYQQLINPLRPIPKSVVSIHGITNALVHNCPPEHDVLPKFLDYLGDPGRTVLMAHNAAFDIAFVGAALERCQLAAPSHPVIDTVRLSRRRAAGLSSHSLDALVRCFGIGPSTEHRGLSDSIALMRVFLNLVARPPQLATLADLYAVVPPRRIGMTRAVGSSPSRRTWSPRRFGSERFGGRDSRQESRFDSVSAPCEESSLFHREISLLLNAIASSRSVSMIYEGGRSAGQRRCLTPIRLVAASGVTYLLAFCHIDQKQKQYRLDRIRELMIE